MSPKSKSHLSIRLNLLACIARTRAEAPRYLGLLWWDATMTRWRGGGIPEFDMFGCRNGRRKILAVHLN